MESATLARHAFAFNENGSVVGCDGQFAEGQAQSYAGGSVRGMLHSSGKFVKDVGLVFLADTWTIINDGDVEDVVNLACI